MAAALYSTERCPSSSCPGRTRAAPGRTSRRACATTRSRSACPRGDRARSARARHLRDVRPGRDTSTGSPRRRRHERVPRRASTWLCQRAGLTRRACTHPRARPPGRPGNVREIGGRVEGRPRRWGGRAGVGFRRQIAQPIFPVQRAKSPNPCHDGLWGYSVRGDRKRTPTSGFLTKADDGACCVSWPSRRSRAGHARAAHAATTGRDRAASCTGSTASRGAGVTASPRARRAGSRWSTRTSHALIETRAPQPRSPQTS